MKRKRFLLLLMMWLVMVALASGRLTVLACGESSNNWWVQTGCDFYFSDDCFIQQVCEFDTCETVGCGSGYITYCINWAYYCTPGFMGCFNNHCA